MIRTHHHTMIHTAITIFSPFDKENKEYLARLAEVRLTNFYKQEFIKEFSILTHIDTRYDCGILDLILKIAEKRKIQHQQSSTIYVVKGEKLPHAGGGQLQLLVKTNLPWVYFNEDGHVIPLRKNSVIEWSKYVLNTDNDAMFAASKLERVNGIRPEHGKWYLDSILKAGDMRWKMKCNEWGFIQRTNTIRKYYRWFTLSRTWDPLLFLLQGAKIKTNDEFGAWFCHHKLISSNCFYLDGEDLLKGEYILPESERRPDLNLFLQKRAQEITQQFPVEITYI